MLGVVARGILILRGNRRWRWRFPIGSALVEDEWTGVTWNCRHLLSLTPLCLERLANGTHADFILLQETHLRQKHHAGSAVQQTLPAGYTSVWSSSKSQRGGVGFMYHNRHKKSGGVTIFDTPIGCAGYLQQFRIPTLMGHLTVFNVYLPPNDADQRDRVWAALHARIATTVGPLLVAGDFNGVPEDHLRSGRIQTRDRDLRRGISAARLSRSGTDVQRSWHRLAHSGRIDDWYSKGDLEGQTTQDRKSVV